jgi:hypothetical protein
MASHQSPNNSADRWVTDIDESIFGQFGRRLSATKCHVQPRVDAVRPTGSHDKDAVRLGSRTTSRLATSRP